MKNISHLKFVTWSAWSSTDSRMKFAVTIFLLAIGAICISAQHVTSWGNTFNTKVLAEQSVDADPGWFQVRERKVTYKSVSRAKIYLNGNWSESTKKMNFIYQLLERTNAHPGHHAFGLLQRSTRHSNRSRGRHWSEICNDQNFISAGLWH